MSIKYVLIWTPHAFIWENAQELQTKGKPLYDIISRRKMGKF